MEFEKHTGIFSTSGDVASALSTGAINKPYMAIVGNELDWNSQEPPPPGPDYSQMYFTIEALSGGSIMMESYNPLYISLDDGLTWNSYQRREIPVSAGDKVLFKGTYNTLNNGAPFDRTTAEFKVYGNIMSLLYGDEFSAATSFPADTSSNFYGLFQGTSKLIDAADLVLPATSLTDYCYALMFKECRNLLTGPVLPATVLSPMCYAQMFHTCPSLTAAPALPATSLTESCYHQMFWECSSLTEAPVLCATTLQERSYYSMFLYCRSLTGITCLATDISANESTLYWTMGVPGSGTFVKNPNMTSWTSGRDGIPTGWTVVDYTP